MATTPVYRRHDPPDTALHGLVRRHVATFLDVAAEQSGRPLPRYVAEEFRAYLRCGVLAHGFARARCEGCGLERLGAFSCKLRGVCPSCGGRRMSATAADVVDRVLPEVLLRRWVLSVPFALRVRLAADAAMLNAVSRVLWEEMRRWYRSASGLTTGDGARVEAAFELSSYFPGTCAPALGAGGLVGGLCEHRRRKPRNFVA